MVLRIHDAETEKLADELDRIALRCARLPVRDRRSGDDILGYDEDGLTH